MKKQRGFSLIELMIVLVVAGIILSFAYPSYLNQVRDTRRADCSGALVSFGNAMERFFTVNSTYVGAAAAVPGPPAATTFVSTACPIDSGTPTYNLVVQAAAGSTYEIRAVPTGDQTNDRCGTLTLNHRGAKGITGATAGLTAQDCW